MMIDIKPEVIDDLREILLVLENVANIHSEFKDNEELIEFWTPSNAIESIHCPDLTVGLIRKAFQIRKALRL
jgi:hypothetical protein